MSLEKKWLYLSDPNQAYKVSRLQESLGIARSICEILVSRGIEHFEEAKTFFRPKYESIASPFLLKGMNEAVTLILDALKENKRILLYGDYDVDGTSSVASLLLFLKTFFPTADLVFYIPNRLTDGYGLTPKGVAFVKSKQPSLLITLDCGIKSYDLIQDLAQAHITCIICDHHIVETKRIPPAKAIINPKQVDCLYPFKELCAAGLTHQLISALLHTLGFGTKWLYHIIDLVGLATSADIVPLVGENRILVREGLQKINTNPSICIKALMECANLFGSVSNHELVFALAPRINAAGRIDNPLLAVELLMEKDLTKARQLARILNEHNQTRREIDSQIIVEATSFLNQQADFTHSFSTIVFDATWHKGVLGIIAAKLVEQYYKPTIVLTESEGILVGSARSIEGCNMVEILSQCAAHLLGFGGHYFAAGLQLERKALPAFSKAFEEATQKICQYQHSQPSLKIDTTVSFAELSLSYYRIVKQMEPFGPLNLRPHFLSKEVCMQQINTIKDKHLKFVFLQDGKSIPAIFFNSIDKVSVQNTTQLFDIVYTLDLNDFRHTQELQLVIKDMKPST